jgi:hypothetical protein
MTVPKKQSTAAKKARTVQRTAGGKHTALLAGQICGRTLDPFGVYPETCARAPHPQTEPCSPDRDFDVRAWQERADAEQAAAQARWDALSSEERAEAERLAFEEAYDDGRTGADEWEDARAWKWED